MHLAPSKLLFRPRLLHEKTLDLYGQLETLKVQHPSCQPSVSTSLPAMLNWAVLWWLEKSTIRRSWTTGFCNNGHLLSWYFTGRTLAENHNRGQRRNRAEDTHNIYATLLTCPELILLRSEYTSTCAWTSRWGYIHLNGVYTPRVHHILTRPSQFFVWNVEKHGYMLEHPPPRSRN